jgi:prolyl oligopeptidase
VFLIAQGADSSSRLLRVPVTGTFAEAKSVSLPSSDALIADIKTASDALYVTARIGSNVALYRMRFDGAPQELKTPLKGMISPVVVSPAGAGGMFKISSWTRPATIYQYDPAAGWKDTKLQPGSGLENKLDLFAKTMLVKSHDGAAVPLTIVYRRGLKRDSSNPVYMVGYGSYGTSIDPAFDGLFVPWFEAGGVMAFAHTRGGGEFGKAWHLAGSKDKKRNTWLDFIACAEYLIEKKYTSSDRLAGGSVSAGGILIGRSITERPGLFAAALISVATTDMLRAEYQMNGPANVVEFGTAKEKVGFEQLLEMSTYHHIKDGVRYPAILVSTGLKDPNVDVWQPAKITARFRAAQGGDRTVLLRVDPEAGHEQYGSTRAQMRELRADQITFLLWQLGLIKGPAIATN